MKKKETMPGFRSMGGPGRRPQQCSERQRMLPKQFCGLRMNPDSAKPSSNGRPTVPGARAQQGPPTSQGPAGPPRTPWPGPGASARVPWKKVAAATAPGDSAAARRSQAGRPRRAPRSQAPPAATPVRLAAPVHCGWGAPAAHCGEPPAQPVAGRRAAQEKRPAGSERAGHGLTRPAGPTLIAFPPRSSSPAP